MFLPKSGSTVQNRALWVETVELCFEHRFRSPDLRSDTGGSGEFMTSRPTEIIRDLHVYRDHQLGCLHATLTTPYPIGLQFLQMFSIFLRLELAVTYWYDVSIWFLNYILYKWCIWFWFYMFAWFSKNEERNWPVFSKAWRQDHPRPIPTVLGHEYKLQLGKLMCVVGPLWKGWG